MDDQNKPLDTDADMAEVQEGKALSCPNCDKSDGQCEEYKQGWQRALADYKNLQKEMASQRSEWAAMSELSILEEFLPVYGNFKKAFAFEAASVKEQNASETGWENWKKGIGFIMKQFGDVLKNHGIEEIKTVGEMFDPARHESVGEEESDLPEHTIVREVEGGYVMKGKVVRVAKVIVAKLKN